MTNDERLPWQCLVRRITVQGSGQWQEIGEPGHASRGPGFSKLAECPRRVASNPEDAGYHRGARADGKGRPVAAVGDARGAVTEVTISMFLSMRNCYVEALLTLNQDVSISGLL